MAQSRRNESRRQLVTEVERAIQDDRARIPGDDETLLDHLGAVQESLNLGHACLHSPWRALAREPRRAQRAVPKRRPALHLARPSAAAEAHFTPAQAEFIE
jgi:hypothetical protein